MGVWKNMSLGRKSVKHKLTIAFSLMSIIPLLSMAYFVTNFIFPDTPESTYQIIVVVLFVLWIAWMGYILASGIIMPVINLAIETKAISEGKYDSEITTDREDELGDIAKAVNAMTGKLRGYLGELRSYSRETAVLNVRIQKKVLTLTSLMKLGELISSGSDFEEVAKFAAKRIAGELYGGFCAIFVKGKAGYSTVAVINNSDKDLPVDDLGSELMPAEKLFLKNQYILIDSRPLTDPWQKHIREKISSINAVFLPMKVKADVIGAIVFGNFGKKIEFDEGEIDVLKAFEKELILGYQSAQVQEQVDNMEVVDSLTGLFKFNYLEERLEDEISRALFYQRPCSFLVVSIDDFEKYSEHFGDIEADQVIREVGKLLTKIVPMVGKIARTSHSEFGILLPEKNKRESLELADDICKKIENMRGSEDKITVSVGVSENPIDGSNARVIIAKAKQYMDKARGQGKNQVAGE